MVTLPDPEVASLLAKITDVEARIVDLSARHAEMRSTLHEFQLQQFRTLGQCLSECLRLRHEYARLRAERSGDAEDAAEAERSAAEMHGFERKQAEAPPQPPEIDPDTRDELKRLYRAAAMRCHPDRVAEGLKPAAQERFQRAQRAYRDHDLSGLRALLRELDQCGDPLAASANEGAGALRKTLSLLRANAADLILSIQTLQIEPDYRRALRRDEWHEYFESARRGFEIECQQLQAAIDALS